MALIGIKTQSVSRRRWRSLATLSHHFQDVVSGLATLKAFGRAGAQPDRVRQVSDDYRRATMGTLRLAFLSSLVLELLSMIAVALVAVGIGLRLAGGEVSFRTALFVLILTPEAYAPLRALGASFHSSADGLAAMDEVDRVLSEPIPAAAAGRPPLRGDLVVADLVVRHPDRPDPAPDRLSLSVAPGEFVAVAGPSGAGKSTLLAVLLGFVAPAAGVVRRGDVPQAEVDPRWWRSQFAWVPQEPVPVRRHGGREHRAGPRGRLGGRDPGSGRDGRRGRRSGDRGGRRWHRTLGRAAPPRRDRPGTAARRRDPAPRRADRWTRRGDRGARSCSRCEPPAGP